MSETRTSEMLKQMQALPLDMKISLTKSRIREWVREFGENDVLEYIYAYNIPICSVYGEVIKVGDNKYTTTKEKRTGCIFCGYGAHHDDRFLRLKETHPKQYNYCINGGEFDENGIWKPNKLGLGMGHVFDELNYIYEKELKSGEIKPFIKYK